MKQFYAVLFAIVLLHSSSFAQQSKEWQYIRPSNTGVSGDYLYTLNIDSFGIKWTTGFYAFWEEGAVNRFDDSVWTNWGSYEGYIPAARVYTIQFDHLHRVWAGTDSGLAVYDGNKWTKYTWRNTPIDKEDFRVNGIAFDKNNNTWITYNTYYLGGSGGVAKFDGSTWTTYTYEKGNLPTRDVTDIVIDKNDSILVGSSSGLIKFTPNGYTVLTKNNSQLQSTSIVDLYIDNNGILWILGGGTLDGVTGATWTHYNKNNSPIDIYSDCFDVYNNKIIVGSTSSKAFIFNGTSWSTYNAPYHVYGTKIDTLGNYWMCGIGFLIKYNGSKTVTYSRYNTGLPEYWENDIFIDSRNRKWFANGNGGVDLLDEPVWKDYGPYNEGLFKNPIPYTTVGAVTTQDKAGDIWMAYEGTYGGVVQIPRGNEIDTAAWKIWETSNAKVDLQFINCISGDSSGKVWVGLDHDSKISIYNRTTKKWKSLKLTDYGIFGGSYTKVRSIATDAQGNVWALNDVGIVVFDNAGNHVASYSVWDAGGLPNTTLFDIAFDSKGNKWIGSDSGLTKFDGINWTTYTTQNSGLLAHTVRSVAVGINDTIYAGTYDIFNYPYTGGLSVFDGSNYWKTFAQGSSPIPHLQVEDVEVDKLGNVWLNCQSEGIAVYHKGGIINEKIPCTAPPNTYTSNITKSSATLNWNTTAGGAQYQVRYKKTGTSVYTTINTTSPRLIISGLQSSTQYQWNVRSKCWKEQFSKWSVNNTFTTGGLFAQSESNQQKNVITQKDFIVSPNPATNYIQVTFTSSKETENEISVTDMQGRVLIRKMVNATASNNMIMLDISRFAKGTYMVKIQNSEEAKVKTIIKQ